MNRTHDGQNKEKNDWRANAKYRSFINLHASISDNFSIIVIHKFLFIKLTIFYVT